MTMWATELKQAGRRVTRSYLLDSKGKGPLARHDIDSHSRANIHHEIISDIAHLLNAL